MRCTCRTCCRILERKEPHTPLLIDSGMLLPFRAVSTRKRIVAVADIR